nr:HTH domain-containing protein [uncultured Cellulosilyticum sp.]
MEIQEQVLEYLKEQGEPMKAGDIADALNLDKKAVSAAITLLKAEQRISSPKRCYYAAV